MVRLIAERGVPVDRLMVITITRMAAGELRERVRARLVSAERTLARAAAGATDIATGGDAALEALLRADPDELRRRATRLARALTQFDAAAITTHPRVLRPHARRAWPGRGPRPRHRLGSMTSATWCGPVVDDLFVARYRDVDPAPFTHAIAQRIARAAVMHRDAPLDPDDGTGSAAERVAFAAAVRAEVPRRLERARAMTYDDLLHRCATPSPTPRVAPRPAR